MQNLVKIKGGGRIGLLPGWRVPRPITAYQTCSARGVCNDGPPAASRPMSAPLYGWCPPGPRGEVFYKKTRARTHDTKGRGKPNTSKIIKKTMFFCEISLARSFPCRLKVACQCAGYHLFVPFGNVFPPTTAKHRPCE